MVKGFQLTLARPSSGLVSLAIFMDKKEGFFFFFFLAYCLYIVLSQNRAHDFIFLLCNNTVPFPAGLWS